MRRVVDDDARLLAEPLEAVLRLELDEERLVRVGDGGVAARLLDARLERRDAGEAGALALALGALGVALHAALELVEVAHGVVELRLDGDGLAQELVAPLVVLGEERVAVELDAAQAAAEARAALGRDGEAGRARQLGGDAILQRQEIASRPVDLGAADDDAVLDADEARGQAHVVADALVGPGGDERSADQLADGDGARHVELAAPLQRLLAEHGVEPPALDDAQPGDGAQLRRHGLADRLAHVPARAARRDPRTARPQR